jgi:hypothetical protein
VAPIPALISSTVEDEGATRRCDLQLGADAEAGVQTAAGGAVGFALDGDAVVAGVGRSGEGVVAEHRPQLRIGLDSQRATDPGGRLAVLRPWGP